MKINGECGDRRVVTQKNAILIGNLMSMKRTPLLLAACVLLAFSLHAQDNAEKKREKAMAVYAGVGRSAFHRGGSPLAFPTLEVRAGVGTVRPMGRHWVVDSRIGVGVRFRRDKPVPPQGGGFSVQETAGRNTYFWEIPLSVQYQFQRTDLVLHAGGIFRRYFPNKGPIGFLAGNHDAGLTAGVGYIVSDRIRLGVEYYHGLTEVIAGEGNYDGQSFRLSMQSRSVQVVVGYKVEW